MTVEPSNLCRRIPLIEEVYTALNCTRAEFLALDVEDRWDLLQAYADIHYEWVSYDCTFIPSAPED